MMIERTFRLSRPLSLRLTLGSMVRGPGDPCMRLDASGFWWATRSFGAGTTLRLSHPRDGLIEATAWGDSAGAALDAVPQLIGEHQDDASFSTDNAVVARLHKEHRGLRIPRTNAVFEVITPLIIGQRVTTREAHRSYRQIVPRVSEPAVGPQHIHLPPDANTLACQPSWWFHRYGVEHKRAETLIHVARAATSLAPLPDLSFEDARNRVLSIQGVGAWTTGELCLLALGDPASVTVGDYHFPDNVAWALAGETRGDDTRMLELLEPFAGRHGRVLRLILHGHPTTAKIRPARTAHCPSRM